ncbi:MAG: phosphate ABC transporter substrate-binding protein [Planctomycetes bacterium]|nr:phosphate ABC transporter substrate-binding protein [Planctomycetota bacterium]MBU4398706.1 phosphate ABC transporter substrate-binding protein [Planctomycetota bacterium]
MALVVSLGCGKRADDGNNGAKKVIRVDGSDTMVNLAQAWAEQYHRKHPGVSVQVLGGGSGVGIASLIDGNCDMANTSRKMKESEIERAKAKRGGEPKEIIVGYDALAIYVHKDNPLDSISMEELAAIYGEEGKVTKWSQLGVKEGRLAGQDITRVCRQSSSGTYVYFREVVLGSGKDFKLGSVDQSGSKDVVALVSRTPSAIGYSGMGYHTPDVKMLKVSKRRGEPGVAPTVDNAKDDSYPITRPLQIYLIGEPAGTVKEYLDWILSSEGQKIVLDLGYVPVKLHE